MFLSLLIFFSGFLGLVFVKSHYFISLMMIEFMFVSLFYFIYIYFGNYFCDYFFLIVFLVFGVCDGVIGLSLIVYLVRSHSFDYFMSMNLF